MFASNPLVRILQTNQLTRPNYKDWLWNLKIVLSFEKLNYVIDQDSTPIPARSTPAQRATHEKWADNDNKARCYVLTSMSNEL